MSKIRVAICDDSALIRRLVSEIINQQPDMEVVAQAADPLEARDLIRRLNPDVLTLDVEMPKMDGLSFLERLMRLHPMPVVMLSSLTSQGSETTLRALELGAVEVMAKPRLGVSEGIWEYSEVIADKIRAAARARVRAPAPPVAPALTADAVLPLLRNPGVTSEKLIAIGSSTGGTEALREVLTRLPADAPAVVVAQHMPPGFTRSFAMRLDQLCSVSVKEAEHRERVLPGHVYIAPGHSHVVLTRSGGHYVIELSQGPPVNRHRPSVDVLFRSVANCAGRNALGVMLTGMGKDGAAGMLEMRQAGAHNLAQDEATCVVFGMPKEAVNIGAVHEVAPLPELARLALNHFTAGAHRARPSDVRTA